MHKKKVSGRPFTSQSEMNDNTRNKPPSKPQKRAKYTQLLLLLQSVEEAFS